MNDYEKEIFQWLEDAGLNPVHHNMAVPHLEVSAQCGLPTELGDVDPTRYVPIPVELLRMGTIFSIDVKGDSMEDAGIYEGNRIEMLLTENESGVRDGDTVVADVDGGVTEKQKEKCATIRQGCYALFPGVQLQDSLAPFPG